MGFDRIVIDSAGIRSRASASLLPSANDPSQIAAMTSSSPTPMRWAPTDPAMRQPCPSCGSEIEYRPGVLVGRGDHAGAIALSPDRSHPCANRDDLCGICTTQVPQRAWQLRLGSGDQQQSDAAWWSAPHTTPALVPCDAADVEPTEWVVGPMAELADKAIVTKFFALAAGPLRELAEHGVDPLDLLLLALNCAPKRGDLRAADRSRKKGNLQTGRDDLASVDVQDRIAEAIKHSNAAATALRRLPPITLWLAPEAPRSGNTSQPHESADLADVLGDGGQPLDRSDPNKAGAFPVDVDNAGRAKALADDLDNFAARLSTANHHLKRTGGRPVEQAENSFILGFADLVHGSMRDDPQKAAEPPRWFDRQASQIFEVVFGRCVDIADYMKTRQRLMKSRATGPSAAEGHTNA